MIKKQTSKHSASSQYQEFVKAARELGCDDDEAHFEEKLKKIARHKPPKDREAGAPQGNTKQSKAGR
jgi:hypothetical protein